MTANPFLVEQRGITGEEVEQINATHEQIYSLIERRSGLGVWNSSVHEAIKQLEFQLQRLWGFSEDESKHRYVREYEFKCAWVKRKFKCNTSGEVFTIPEDVYETACYFWGDGAMVDTGRLSFYSRFSNCTEITGESYEIHQ